MQTDKPSLLRTLLILGRVSNLPTVWSNCLAGWLLGGGKSEAWISFVILCLGSSLLYIGGMYLNDYCDRSFDTQHRTERPIPSGRISPTVVLLGAVILLSGGLGQLAALGKSAAIFAIALVVCIILYDIVHKRTALAPLLMAGCRFLLYLVAGSAALGSLSPKLLWCAGSLSVYIIGLSYIARKEAQSVTPSPWASRLVFVPLLPAIRWFETSNPFVVLPLMLGFTAWVLWFIRAMALGGPRTIGRTVSALLAGIVLVDMLAVQGGGGMMPLAFLALFASALILQRTIPAT